jgi:hypothetical protein
MAKTVTKFSELESAFYFVNSGDQWGNIAYLCLATGEYHYYSEFGDNEEPLPDDIEDSDKFIVIPHKNDLDLGTRLVLRFAAQVLPDDLDEIDRIFHRRGAYRQFKRLLEWRGKLEEWYEFETQSQREALREWCADNDIELEE